jgi:hypothetical protein
MDATISGNTATMAGGGIYNMAITPEGNGSVRGKWVMGISGTITGNSAKAGGGVVNRGELWVMSTASITSNVASGTGSGETCHSGSCDGFGGGVLNLSSSAITAGFRTMDHVSLSLNTATGLGGAFYNTGQLNLSGITIASNTAKSGAAIFAAALLINGTPQSNYCTFTNELGQSSINSNKTVPSGPAAYSIVDSSGASGTYCTFGAASASNNTTPRCALAGLPSGASCPQ